MPKAVCIEAVASACICTPGANLSQVDDESHASTVRKEFMAIAFILETWGQRILVGPLPGHETQTGLILLPAATR